MLEAFPTPIRSADGGSLVPLGSCEVPRSARQDAALIVRATGLVKHFGPRTAIDGVELTVRAGEVRGVLGLNGAGKTTLLRMLLGLVAPDQGSVQLCGRPATAGSLDGVAGFVEEPCFYPYLSARVNLELLAELDGPGARERIDEALATTGLTDRAGDRVNGFSTGMRQRLGIAAALLRAPRLLILDEPTSGLDPAGARDVRALIKRLAGAGVAVLLSSHQIGEVEEVCDSFTVLRRGRTAWAGTAAQLRAQAPASAHKLSTSDDARALELAAGRPGSHLVQAPDGELVLTAAGADLDAYALALGRAGVAIRRLELLASPLEAMFFALTAERDGEPDPAALPAPPEQVGRR